MLQQTQVATVIDYFLRFMKRFPNCRSLAEADEQEVLSLWSGLGYYRRARQMHRAAQQIVEDWEGQFPVEFDEILSLPGIGRYTAGAVHSFSVDGRSPIVEANTIRLFSRLLALPRSPTERNSQTQLWQFAESILPQRGPGSGEVNQALMELGSLVCTPTEPECDDCPVSRYCAAFSKGIQHEIPLRTPKVKVQPRMQAALIFRKRDRLLMRQNLPGQWWEGLWDFPRVDLPSSTKQPVDDRVVAEAFLQQYGHNCQVGQQVKLLKHSVTRYRIALHCFEAQLTAELDEADSAAQTWCWTATSTDLPLTSSARVLCDWLMQNRKD